MKIKSIVSSFLAVAIAMTATTALTSIDASAEDYGTAWVMFTGTDERTEKDKGSSDNVDATITKDGSYTATAVAAPAEKLQLLVLQTDLKDTDYPDVKITVDSITVNGVAVEYTQSDDAFKMEEDMGYRVNILNTLGNDAVKDIAEDVALKLNGRYIPTANGITGTFMLPDSSTSTITSRTVRTVLPSGRA